jgi:hypothetical protein
MALSLQGILTPEALGAFSGLQAAVNRQIQNVGKVRNQKGEYVTPESILGRATYSWASPEALGQAPGSFDYQNIPYSGNFGVGIANLGVDESNKETFFENPFVRAGLAAAAGALTGNVALGAELGTAATTASKLAASDLTNRATAPKQPKQKALQPTGSTPNVTKNVEDVKQASKRKLQKLQAPTYSASKPSETAPLTNLGQYFPKDIYDRSVYESDYEGTDAAGNRIGDVTNPYNLIALAPKDSKTAPPILRSINQFFPQDVYDRSVTDAALLPDNNIVDRARLTNMAEGFVDPKTSQERASDFLNKLTGLGLGMAQDAKTTPPVFLTPPPVSGQRFQYNPYKFGSPQGMPISFLANRARGQMKTPFQYELEKLVRKV